MKKFIINLLKFLAIAIPFYGVVLFVWSSLMPPFMAKNVRNCVGCYGHLFSRIQDVEKIKNPDILFLGSSHAYRGFDTRVFEKLGYNTFNLGSSSQTPINTKVLIHQYIDKIKPKLVVYEVYAGTLSRDAVESSLDMMSNNKIDQNSLQMAFETHNLMTYNTLIYGYFRQILGLNKNFKENQRQGDDFYIKGGGYVETNFRKNNFEKFESGKWNINPKQITALRENLEILKEKNIPYILVQTPITNYYYNSKTNNEEIDNILSSLGNYKNFQGEIALNDTLDFYDSNHMNQEAVVKFNRHFIEYLEALKTKK